MSCWCALQPCSSACSSSHFRSPPLQSSWAELLSEVSCTAHVEHSGPLRLLPCLMRLRCLHRTARLSALIPLVFFWPLIVYSPIAHWTWMANGWLATLGAIDFAGGSPVHVASGAASMAMSMYLSKPLFRSRKSKTRALRVLVEHRPHNLMQLCLAGILIWNGWLGMSTML